MPKKKLTNKDLTEMLFYHSEETQKQINELLSATNTAVSILTDYLKFKGETEEFQSFLKKEYPESDK